MSLFIDLSIPIEHKVPSDPPVTMPEIEYVAHDDGAVQMISFFQGLKKEQLPKGKGWTVENLKISTHSGTHMDAPYHYHPTTNNGVTSPTIDKIPLEWCYGNGVMLDFTCKKDGEKITVSDIKDELSRIKCTLKPLDIVLIHTGMDKYWGTPEYLRKGPGMTKEGTLFLLNQGVKITGIDAWSWDRPFCYIQEEFKQTNDPSVIWEAHFAGIEKEYCHMEKMANFSAIGRPYGFKLCCFPVKIKNASASWVRPVAILD